MYVALGTTGFKKALSIHNYRVTGFTTTWGQISDQPKRQSTGHIRQHKNEDTKRRTWRWQRQDGRKKRGKVSKNTAIKGGGRRREEYGGYSADRPTTTRIKRDDKHSSSPTASRRRCDHAGPLPDADDVPLPCSWGWTGIRKYSPVLLSHPRIKTVPGGKVDGADPPWNDGTGVEADATGPATCRFMP
jgi:hypothetical protein